MFSQQAQFRFDPLYYNFEKIGIRVSETGRTPALETVRAYSGKYDISKDSLICESVIGSQMQSQQQGVFILSWILVQQISCIIQSIRIIRSAGF